MIALGLTLLSIPFLLPIISWVMTYRLRSRVLDLESRLAHQQGEISSLTTQLTQLRKRLGTPPVVEAPKAQAPAPAHPFAPAPAPAPANPKAAPSVEPPVAAPERRPSLPPAPAIPPRPAAAPAGPTVPPPPPRPRPAAPSEPPPPSWSIDWERFVGVRLFSAIAGIALVVAAVFFLRYSLDAGWLQPPVRVLIGMLAGVGLLVVCELKAARKYPATANALDAAAIATLFATFFSAHALWNLIPATVAFGLLALVTAVAVALSIRRESLFIAVLGLLGGFATPALLSTGENRPIPLFAYLVLLNVGLAWVAYRQAWPVLTVLTLVLTTFYQWVWVYKFLSASDLSLAMGIFTIFPILSVGAMLFGRHGRSRAPAEEDETFERTTVIAAALPLMFVIY